MYNLQIPDMTSNLGHLQQYSALDKLPYMENLADISEPQIPHFNLQDLWIQWIQIFTRLFIFLSKIVVWNYQQVFHAGCQSSEG